MTLRERLRTIGQAWRTPPTSPEPKSVKKVFDVLGGFFQFSTSKLSDEKSISTKLLNQNKEWVYRNNDVIAKEVSKIEFELYSIGLKNGEVTYSEVESHPLLDLLARFNDKTTKADAIYTTQSHKKLTGDCFWLLDGPVNDPTNIFVLQPDKVELKIGDPTDATATLIEGYTYKDTINGKSIEKFYRPEEVIHFKNPNPNNMFRGLGAVEAMAETIDIDNLTNLTTRKYFENGAITNFVLSTEAKITDEQLKRFRAELNAAYGGVNKAYKTMILGGGLKPEKISFSNKDMEFLSQLEWYRDKIMVGFGNTKASLGIVDDVNRASHESSIISWKNTTVKPDMEAIVDTLNEFLVPVFGKNLVLGFCDPVPENREAKLTEIEKAKSILSINERRALLGYDTVVDGDTIPEVESGRRADLIANTPVAPPVPKSLTNIDLKAVLRRNGWVDKKIRAKAIREAVRPYAEDIVKSRKKVKQRTHNFTDEQAMSYYAKQMKIVDVLEQRFENAINQFLDKIKGKAIANLDTLVPKEIKNKQLFDEGEEIIQATIDFTPILTETAVAAGQQAYNLIGVDNPYLATNMKNQIRRNIEKFASSMLDTDKQYLTDLIADGIKEGQSVAQISRRIDTEFAEYTRKQATRITRTEVLRVSNQSTIDAFEESGVVEGKQWLTAPGADEICAEYEGKIVYDLKGNFYSSENEFQDGDPPIHPNCRCVVIPVLTGEKKLNAPIVKDLKKKIAELESQIDKRKKDYRAIKKLRVDDQAYIKALEKLSVVDESKLNINDRH